MPATTLSNRTQLTFYFRHAFEVTNTETFARLTARLVRDDGAVVYLNGSEAFRDNMPAGAVTFATRALTTVSGADENTYFTHPIGLEQLLEGLNVLAVEVHQTTNTSSDVSFDLELLAEPAPPALNATLAGAGVTLSWPIAPGFALEVTTNLSPPVIWSPVTNAVFLVSNAQTFTLPIALPASWFRLRR